MKNVSKILVSLFLGGIILGITNGCFTTIDIGNEESVIKDMQGSWVGNDHEGGIYTHYKLEISGNNFSGWLTTANTIDEPSWSGQPNETGTLSLSPVQGYTNASGKYRNINFIKAGGGFGDNSLIARAFTHMIIYDDGGGLYVVGWGNMSKK